MTIPLWPALNYNRGPISQVQPFSYQDDVVFLDILYKQRDYIQNTLVPHVNGISTAIDEALAGQIAAVDSAIANVIAGNDVKIQSLTQYVDNAVQSIVNESIEVQDSVIAGALNEEESESRGAANAIVLEQTKDRPYARVWDEVSEEYVPDSPTVFFGDTDPGLAQDPDDFWASPDATTLDNVVSEMDDISSPLHAAAKRATALVSHSLSLFSNTWPMKSFGEAQPNFIWGVGLPKAGNSSVIFSGRVPDEWTSAKLCFRWVHNSDVGNGARLNIYYSVADTGITHSHTTTTSFTTAKMQVSKITVDGVNAVTGNLITGAIVRLSAGTGDTITGDIGILDVWIERTS